MQNTTSFEFINNLSESAQVVQTFTSFPVQMSFPQETKGHEDSLIFFLNFLARTQ